MLPAPPRGLRRTDQRGLHGETPARSRSALNQELLGSLCASTAQAQPLRRGVGFPIPNNSEGVHNGTRPAIGSTQKYRALQSCAASRMPQMRHLCPKWHRWRRCRSLISAPARGGDCARQLTGDLDFYVWLWPDLSSRLSSPSKRIVSRARTAGPAAKSDYGSSLVRFLANGEAVGESLHRLDTWGFIARNRRRMP
jgi:hypothetical protein